MENSQDIISVIVPVYKVEQYLDECLESIVNQTYHNLEIILVDDGSPDRCPQLCDEWAAKDNRIKVIHKPNGGLSDARNVGIEAAGGQYLTFVDSDDFIVPDALETLHTLLHKTDAEISCGGVYRYSDGSRKRIFNRCVKNNCTVYSGLDTLRHVLMWECDCSAWGKLYRRDAIKDLRFINGRYNEDVMFLFALYPEVSRVAYTCEPIYNYRAVDGSVTSVLNIRTMDALVNTAEMEDAVRCKGLPVKAELKYYSCRINLELGYIIQRENARKKFSYEAAQIKHLIRSQLSYIAFNSGFNLRDLIHALIVAVKL